MLQSHWKAILREQALAAVACPECKAGATDPCVGSRNNVLSKVHPERMQLFLRMEMVAHDGPVPSYIYNYQIDFGRNTSPAVIALVNSTVQHDEQYFRIETTEQGFEEHKKGLATLGLNVSCVFRQMVLIGEAVTNDVEV